MIKKLSGLFTTLFLFVLFTIPAFAEEGVEVTNSSQTQNSESTVVQNQNVNSEGTAESIVQDQDSINEKTQNQDVNQDGSLQQEQSTTIDASQNQIINNADVLDTTQNQHLNIEASQSQTSTNTQDQSTTIETTQDQSIKSEETKKAEQEQSVSIDNKQEQVLNNSDSENVNKNETDAYAKQVQDLLSKGDAELSQSQSVELEAAEIEDGKLTANTSTNITIIDFLVSVIQSIEMNGDVLFTYDESFEIGDDPTQNEQSKLLEFDWGTVSIINRFLVEKGEGDFIHSWMESIIDIKRYRPEPPPEEPTEPTPEEPTDPTPVDPTEPTPEEPTDPSEYYDEWIDSDGDGLCDDEEIRWGLNPFNRDTDGDGLTDYFEVIYFKKDVLDPRIKDTDKDGIIDSEEDFDNDGLSNIAEQKRGTNPHVANN